MIRTATAATFALVLGAGVASASTVINFGAPGAVTSGIGSQSGTFSQGGFSGSLEANANCDFICSPVLTQDASEGIGVSAYENVPFLGDDDPAIDGDVLGESLSIIFDVDVLIKKITFGFVDPEDDWDISVDGTQVADESTTNSFHFAPNTVGREITVSADDAFEQTGELCLFRKCFPTGGPDDFTVLSVEVGEAPNVIPLPAAGWFLLGGLGSLAALRRRRKT